MSSDIKRKLLKCIFNSGHICDSTDRTNILRLLQDQGVMNNHDYYEFFQPMLDSSDQSVIYLSRYVNEKNNRESFGIMIVENIAEYTEEEVIRILYCCSAATHRELFLSNTNCLDVIRAIPIDQLDMLSVIMYHTSDECVAYLNDKPTNQILDMIDSDKDSFTGLEIYPLIKRIVADKMSEGTTIQYMIQFFYLFGWDDVLYDQFVDFMQEESTKNELMLRIHFGKIVRIKDLQIWEHLMDCKKLIEIYEKVHGNLFVNANDPFSVYCCIVYKVTTGTTCTTSIEEQIVTDANMMRGFYSKPFGFNFTDPDVETVHSRFVDLIQSLTNITYGHTPDVLDKFIDKMDEFFELCDSIKKLVRESE